MDFSFREPNMELFVLLHNAKHKDGIQSLREYLVDHSMYTLYTTLVQKGLLENNKDDLNKIVADKENKLNSLLEEKKKDPENSTFVQSVNIKIAELHASCLDLDDALEDMRTLLREEASLSFKMDVHLCKIRMGILLRNKSLVEASMEDARDVFVRGCDWDRRNKFKIYQGIYFLMKGRFLESAQYFNESLPSFESNEMVSYKDAVQYMIFAGLLTYSRTEIKTKLIECSEVNEVGSPESINLIKSLYECNYYDYLPMLYKFLSSVSHNVYLSHFIDYFCKEMKKKAYKQLLDSYQFISISNMAQLFGIEESYLEEDLASFIVEGDLNCKIDKIDGIILVEDVEDQSIQKIIDKGNNLIRMIKKNVK
ncbi:26S proteasome non-ATPase regulatory subunit 6 [Nosema granulosis]|uniref:26S proteasome non-ATPase regulatory subunit 6 n=1 Tax=Nosema granulosis TaxID=83296 RepID=A0A9P6H3X3_9MICR|nr:26S proteasome non-ATPase regulatory subunit 6 [Nosema granulosis]